MLPWVTPAVLTLALALQGSPDSAGSTPDAESAAEAEREADALFQRGELEAAKRKVSEANRIAPRPGHLWMLAEIERTMGNCDAAVILYRQYHAELDDAQRAKVRPHLDEALDECGETLAPTPEVAPSPVPPPVPPPPIAALPPAPPRRPDALTFGLLGGGIATAAVGGALLGIGVQRGLRASPGAATEMEFLAARDDARTLRVAGGVVLGASASLLVGAAIRRIIVVRRRSDRAQPFVAGGSADMSSGGSSKSNSLTSSMRPFSSATGSAAR